MNKFLTLFTALLLSGCDLDLGESYSSTTKTAYVDYYQEACTADGTDMCFRLRFDTDDDFEVSTLPTTGFDDLMLGKRYTLQVEAERDDSGNDSAYSLQNIDSEVVVDAASNSFVLTFDMSSQILLKNSDTSWIISAEDIFECSAADCVTLTNSYDVNDKVQLEFSAENDQLTLIKVQCASAENTFGADCEGINEKEWDIAHYQSDCGLFEPKLCLVYRDSDSSSSDPWYILPFDIANFTPVWGTEYSLEVEAVTAAGSLKKATWVKDVSTTDKQIDNFIVVMRTGASGIEQSSAGLVTYDDVDFNCDINNQCDDIDDAIEEADADEEVIIALEVISDGTSLTVQRLICNAKTSDFQEDCADENDDIIWFTIE